MKYYLHTTKLMFLREIAKAQYLCKPMSKPKLIKFAEYSAFDNTYDIEDAAKVKGQ